MTPQAKLVVAPKSLEGLADLWSRAGLLAEFAWLDSETVGRGLTPEEWQTATARIMQPGRGAVDQRLMEYLSRLEGSTSVLALWLRAPDDAGVAGFASAEAFLQQVYPGVMTRVRIDLINPRQLGQHDVPDGIQGWQQFVIATQDNPELSQPDAGWSLKKDVVALHTAAALAGVLGGSAVIEPLGGLDAPRFVHVFSRHVTGGRTARLAAVRYLDEQLPVFDASDIAPQHFGRPLKPKDTVDNCVEWLEGANGAALRYTPPEPVDVSTDLRIEGLAGVGLWRLALRQLVSKEPIEPMIRVESDLAERIAQLTRDLENEAAKEGARPPADVWRAAFRLVTSIVDGGAPPSGFSRASWVDRQIVLPADEVDPDPAYEPADYPPSFVAEHPQFQAAPPVPIAASAITGVAEGLEQGPAPFRWEVPEPPGADLAERLNEQDAAQRREQGSALREQWRDAAVTGEPAPEDGPVSDPKEPTRLVDRLFRDVLRDSVRARRDAVRWHGLAVSPWPPAQPPGRSGGGGLVLAGAAVIGGWTAAWPLLGPLINGLVDDLIGSPLPGLVGPAFGWVVGLVLVGVGVALLARGIKARIIAARIERAMRDLLADRALVSYQEAGRLDHVVRIFGLWWRIYRDVHGSASEPPDASTPSSMDAPASLQTGDPAIHVNYEPLMVAKAATDPGWRSGLVLSLTAACLQKYGDRTYEDPGTDLCSDLGMPEGVLHRLARDLATGAIWQDWRLAEIDRISTRIRDSLVQPETHVDRMTGQTVQQFLGEVLGPAGITPGVHQLPANVLDLPVESHLYVTENARAAAADLACRTIEGTWLTGAAAVHVALAPVPCPAVRKGETAAELTGERSDELL